MSKHEFKDCLITIKKDIYTIENSKIKREFRCKDGIFHTISFYDKSTKTEWIDSKGTEHDFSYEGLLKTYSGEAIKLKVLNAKTSLAKNDIFQKDSLSLYITLFDENQKLTINRKYTVYPDIAAIAVKTTIKTQVVPNFYGMTEFNHKIKMKACDSVIDRLETAKIAKCKTVSLFGRTDSTNEMVREENFSLGGKKEFSAVGSMFFAMDKKSNGLFFVQEAPSTGEKRREGDYDFVLKNGTLKNIGWGILPTAI